MVEREDLESDRLLRFESQACYFPPKVILGRPCNIRRILEEYLKKRY